MLGIRARAKKKWWIYRYFTERNRSFTKFQPSINPTIIVAVARIITVNVSQWRKWRVCKKTWQIAPIVAISPGLNGPAQKLHAGFSKWTGPPYAKTTVILIIISVRH